MVMQPLYKGQGGSIWAGRTYILLGDQDILESSQILLDCCKNPSAFDRRPSQNLRLFAPKLAQ